MQKTLQVAKRIEIKCKISCGDAVAASNAVYVVTAVVDVHSGNLEKKAGGRW